MNRAVRAILPLAGIALAAVYLVNPGAGVFELLPDALPVVGNLDEAAMTALLLHCVGTLRQLRSEEPSLPSTGAPGTQV